MAPDRKRVDLGSNDVLIVVDVQKCFLPGGPLAVSEGDRVIGPLNRAIEKFQRRQLPIFFSRDWHAPDHISFRQRGGPWPPHCVRASEGAAFPPELNVPENAMIVSKGTRRDEEEYSALAGRDGNRRLEEILSGAGVERVFVGGVATDYCVLNTVLDAAGAGYEVFLLTDAIKPVEAAPGDNERALQKMREAGARMIETEDIG
ncbi:MAG TPA: isochorismatase family protein [Syntrophales bacterium]|nr:isochorismatase family protein [Syntrophales bacterium]